MDTIYKATEDKINYLNFQIKFLWATVIIFSLVIAVLIASINYHKRIIDHYYKENIILNYKLKHNMK